jgi:hypothetical protein
MYGLTKLAHFYKEARSLNAINNKRYKRMLDSMEVGKGNWENKLMESGERSWPNIYHGTNELSKDDIDQTGLKPQQAAEFGRGVFFGPKKDASKYSDGTLYRLKNPTEMKNTNATYPRSIPKVLGIDPRSTFLRTQEDAEDLSKQLQSLGVEPYVLDPDTVEYYNQANPYHLQRYGLLGNQRIMDARKRHYNGRREFHIDEQIPRNLLIPEHYEKQYQPQSNRIFLNL